MTAIATPANVRTYLLGLQSRITGAIAAMDGGEFLVDAWEKPPGEMLQGNGLTKILEGGMRLFACARSQVAAERYPTPA